MGPRQFQINFTLLQEPQPLVDARVRRKLARNGLKMVSASNLRQNSLNISNNTTKSNPCSVQNSTKSSSVRSIGVPEAQILPPDTPPDSIRSMLHPVWPPAFAARMKDAGLKLSKGVPRREVIEEHGRIVVETVEETEEEMRKWRREGWRVEG
jgi:hypothetical protein